MLRAWACCVMTRWARLSASVVARVRTGQPRLACRFGLHLQKICHGLGVAGSDELRSPFGLFAPCPAPDVQCCRGGCSAGDYASLRADVVKAYAQQAAEMTQSLTVLQALSTDTAVMLTRLESACAK